MVHKLEHKHEKIKATIFFAIVLLIIFYMFISWQKLAVDARAKGGGGFRSQGQRVRPPVTHVKLNKKDFCPIDDRPVIKRFTSLGGYNKVYFCGPLCKEKFDREMRIIEAKE